MSRRCIQIQTASTEGIPTAQCIQQSSGLISYIRPIKHDNPEYKECLEKLDKLIVEIQLKAETQCCLP
jgi:hypothetical protein